MFNILFLFLWNRINQSRKKVSCIELTILKERTRILTTGNALFIKRESGLYNNLSIFMIFEYNVLWQHAFDQICKFIYLHIIHIKAPCVAVEDTCSGLPYDLAYFPNEFAHNATEASYRMTYLVCYACSLLLVNYLMAVHWHLVNK